MSVSKKTEARVVRDVLSWGCLGRAMNDTRESITLKCAVRGSQEKGIASSDPELNTFSFSMIAWQHFYIFRVCNIYILLFKIFGSKYKLTEELTSSKNSCNSFTPTPQVLTFHCIAPYSPPSLPLSLCLSFSVLPRYFHHVPWKCEIFFQML